ncbi:MAG: hydroxymethylglutaryl-CoA reductase, partial [Gemmatimonadales bacterium]
MKIPALLLRQLYTFGSLENDAEGFRFSLKNRLSDAQLTRIHGIRVDDTEVPLQHLRIDLGDGRTMAAADVTPQAPAPFALRQVARVIARGVPLAKGSHEIRCDVETDSFGRLEICAMDAIATAQPPRPSIPWDPDQRANFGAEMVARRRRFAEEYTGVTLKHVSGYSFDPVVAAGNIENFTGVAQVPLGFAGPLRINGEHANGEFLIPLATTEGTLVASYNRGMKVLNLSGGVTCTLSADCMQRAPVFVFASA